MKLYAVALFVCLSAAASLPAADGNQAPKGPRPPAGVPATATLVEPGTWKDTDAKGKAWLYRVTPFGVSKIAAVDEYGNSVLRSEQQKSPSSADTANITARIDGDTIHFQQPTPFGTKKWDRKATDDLASTEKAALEIARQRQSATPAAGAAK